MTQQTKRPDQRANADRAVSKVLNQQRKNDMNLQTDTTKAAKPATIPVSFNVDITADMDASARRALYDAFYLASEAIQGVLIQPRCYVDDGSELNGAGRYLDCLSDFFGHCTDALIKSEKNRKDADPTDNERRLFLILRHEAHMVDDLAMLAAMAARYVCEQNDCEWDAKHGRKAVAA
jgi:hypothetical protein